MLVRMRRIVREMLRMGRIVRRGFSVREILTDERLSWSSVRSGRARSTCRSGSSVHFHRLPRGVHLLLLILWIPFHLLLVHSSFGHGDLASGEMGVRIPNLQRISTGLLRRLRRIVRLILHTDISITAMSTSEE